MSRFNKFYALSAVYFGLASAVGAETTGTASGASTSNSVQAPGTAAPSEHRASPRPNDPMFKRNPAQSGGQAAKDRFEHPMLERQSGAGFRSGEKPADRLQRRGEVDDYRHSESDRRSNPSR